MATVNALQVRNRLGSILKLLEKTGEPILVSKGREIRAVLITPGDYRRRFLDHQAEEAKKQFLETFKECVASRKGDTKSIDVLRELRGYSK